MINRIALSLLLLPYFLSYLSSAPANLLNFTTTSSTTSTPATTFAVTTEPPTDAHRPSVPVNTNSNTDTTDSVLFTSTTTTPSPLATTVTTKTKSTTESRLNSAYTSHTNKNVSDIHELPKNGSAQPHTVKGRVVLATTREQGSNVWGLTEDKAEEACHRFANNSDITRTISKPNESNNTSTESTNVYQGHLLSVTSNEETSDRKTVLSVE
ncbi:unnamed protein product [Trichobilharzia regenti]|nr:unnamed protein product [Trichobilharzia regenti]